MLGIGITDDLTHYVADFTKKAVEALEAWWDFATTCIGDLEAYMKLFPNEIYSLISAFFALLIGIAIVKCIGGLIG